MGVSGQRYAPAAELLSSKTLFITPKTTQRYSLEDHNRYIDKPIFTAVRTSDNYFIACTFDEQIFMQANLERVPKKKKLQFI
jgi:hypothetical protein